MKSPFLALMLFTNDVELAGAASAAGVDRIVIDLEQRGKRERQHGYHLECNGHTIDDLVRIRAAVPSTIVCRVNAFHSGTEREVEAVIQAGADVVMLPMFRHTMEVERFLKLVAGRVCTSLLFETREAVVLAKHLDAESFDEAYVGLNDLAISYGASFCYELLADGTVDNVRACFPGKPFGFGGITVLDGGRPLATRLILLELARLRSTQVIVRRAFKQNIQGRDLADEVRQLKAFYAACLARGPEQIEMDQTEIRAAISRVATDLCHEGSAHIS